MLSKLFGGIDLTWPKVVVAAVVAGIVTALAAMFVPDGNSLRQIAVSPEAWVVIALLVVVNCETPKDAALKAFVFFLVSQPLVYLVQVLAGFAGWELFNYYGYWFMWTLAMLPAGFIGWHVKDGTVVSALLLSVLCLLELFFATGYAKELLADPPTYLLATLFCICSVPFMIFGVLGEKKPRAVAGGIAAAGLVAAIAYVLVSPAASLSVGFPLDGNKLGAESGWTAQVKDGGAVQAVFRDPADSGSDPYLSLENVSEPGDYNVVLTGADGTTYRLTVTVTEDNGAPRAAVKYEDGTVDRW